MHELALRRYKTYYLTSSGELTRNKNIKREGSGQKKSIGPTQLFLAPLFPIKWDPQIQNRRKFWKHPLAQWTPYT